MKILHLVDSSDPPFLLRLQERDAALLNGYHDVERWTIKRGHVHTPVEEFPGRRLPSEVVRSDADACHFYTRHLPSGSVLSALKVPWVAAASGSRGWFSRRSVEPDRKVSPHPAFEAGQTLPEMVDSAYFETSRDSDIQPVVAGIVVEATEQQYQGVRSRIARLRDDVGWRTFEQVPPPSELSGIMCWVDFGIDHETDESGVPEAIVSGCTTIAPRTELNRGRLLEGDAGFLVPRFDPNEMAHVILTALFRPEAASQRLDAALANRDRFRSSRRLRDLNSLYESLSR